MFNEADSEQPIKEAACFAHARRKFYDIHVATQSPLAEEVLQRSGGIYAIEETIRGRSPDERRRVRQARTGPRFAELKTWLSTNSPRRSAVALERARALLR